jgi:seryl-tRNA synthetase
MLDIKFIRENVELVKEGARKKRIEVDVDSLLKLDDERRRLIAEAESLRAERNKTSKEIPRMKGEERDKAVARMKEVGGRIKELEKELEAVDAHYNLLMLKVPNVPADDVPEGKDESDNVPIKSWGTIPTFDFTPKDHTQLGEELDIIDVPRGVKLAGPRSYFLKNEGVLLELAVLKFALDHITKKGFVPMIVPQLVKDEAMIGTAYFPGGEEQAYRFTEDGLNLIGTSEVPVTSYHYDEILSEDELPKYYAGYSTCFRREAGTYGKDTRGIYRIHQFQKVEQVVICINDAETSIREHEHILRNSEEVVQALGLPYRVVNVCTGDLGQPHVKKWDIEVWMPGRGGYGETHSCSRFYDFQARRLRLRYKTKDGQIRYAHTLNNTVIASPRILIPILENYQQADGSVVIPEVLRPYMGGMEKIGRKK